MKMARLRTMALRDKKSGTMNHTRNSKKWMGEL